MQQNFYSALKPFIIFLSCLGVLPYCFKNNKVCTSYLHSIYVALLVLLYIILFCDATFGIHQGLKKTTRASQIIYVTANIVNVLITLINTITRRKKFAKFSNAMLDCEKAFREVMEIPYKTTKRKIYMHVAIYIIILVHSFIFRLLFFEQSFMNKISKYLIEFAFSLLTNYSVGVTAIAHILEMHRGFKVLNECLKRMQINHKWKKLQFDNILKQKSWKPNIENLAKIGRLHLKLTNCIKEFNDTFAVILVANYVMAFMAEITMTYFCYYSYLLSAYIYTYMCGTLAVTYAINVGVLCQKSYSTIQEVISTFRNIKK